MGIMEIILLLFGCAIFIGSFLIPAEKKKQGEKEPFQEETVRKIIDEEIKEAKSQICDIVDETITYAMEKTERSMERLTNEKIMAVNEYSDTVLEEINKNHKEAVFLYDMLSDKHENLKSTVSEASAKADQVKQTLKDAEVTAKEAKDMAVKAAEAAAANKTEEQNVPLPKEEADHAKAPEPELTEQLDFKPIEARKVFVLPQAAEEASKEEQTGQEDGDQKPKTARTKTAKAQTKSAKEKAQKADQAAKDQKKEETAPKEVRVTLGTDGQEQEENRNSNDRILALHKAGKSNISIARELGLGIGEVKLVIDLFEGQ